MVDLEEGRGRGRGLRCRDGSALQKGDLERERSGRARLVGPAVLGGSVDEGLRTTYNIR